ncbi:hypothetical protein Y032_0043g832 [Ancylostoma ceylanicum]|nr:hypothetical protein Y032_0043g832 [Ancylostoma ceylanicum]
MKCPLSNNPTAAEILEATKKLYVKTDALIQRKLEPGQPRLFSSTDDEELEWHQLPSPSAPALRIPSRRSAFRLVSLPSTQNGGQMDHSSACPPPLLPRSTSLSHDYPSQVESAWKPKPKPRLSVMRSMQELSMEEAERPQPKPRRKVLPSVCEPVADGEAHPISCDALRGSPFNYRRKFITKSSPNLSAPSVAALKRRVNSLRSATPVVHAERMDCAMLGDAECKSWFASLVLLGYAFMNPGPVWKCMNVDNPRNSMNTARF